jgi:cell division transport system permease protein
MRLKFVFSEVFTGLLRNLTMTIAMVLTTAISLGLLGAGMLMVRQVDEMKDLFYYKLEVSIFLKQDVANDQRDALRTALNSDPLVKEVLYESKDDAYSRFRQQFHDTPELVNNVDPHALPESFRVKLKNPKNYEVVATKYKSMVGVDEVVDQRQILDRMFHILDLFRYAALTIAIIQAVAALLLIANTIQVAAFSRRREVGIMRLVGASNWYIQLPFVLEAAFAGLVGAIVGVSALCAAKVFFVDHVFSAVFKGVIPTWDWQWIASTGLVLTLGAIGGAATAGWATLRFQIKI